MGDFLPCHQHLRETGKLIFEFDYPPYFWMVIVQSLSDRSKTVNISKCLTCNGGVWQALGLEESGSIFLKLELSCVKLRGCCITDLIDGSWILGNAEGIYGGVGGHRSFLGSNMSYWKRLYCFYVLTTNVFNKNLLIYSGILWRVYWYSILINYLSRFTTQRWSS